MHILPLTTFVKGVRDPCACVCHLWVFKAPHSMPNCRDRFLSTFLYAMRDIFNSVLDNPKSQIRVKI